MNEDFFELDPSSEVLIPLMDYSQARCIVIETEYTLNYLEKTNYRDRGRWKWFAETKVEAFENQHEESAKLAHIDGGDLFPRLYFHSSSFVEEFNTWADVRQQTIKKIKIPKEYSLGFSEDDIKLVDIMRRARREAMNMLKDK